MTIIEVTIPSYPVTEVEVINGASPADAGLSEGQVNQLIADALATAAIDATTKAGTAQTNAVALAAADASSKVAVEAGRATGAEGVLATAITTEQNRAIAAEAAVQYDTSNHFLLGGM